MVYSCTTPTLRKIFSCCIYESNANHIMLNRSNFENTDRPSIDEGIDVLEDLGPGEFNYDGIAIEETIHKGGIRVMEDTDYVVDNPGA